MSGILLRAEKTKVYNLSIDTNIRPILTAPMKAYSFITALICHPDNLIACVLFSGSCPQIFPPIIPCVSIDMIHNGSLICGKNQS